MTSVYTPTSTGARVKVANFSEGVPANIGIRKGAYVYGVQVHTGAASVNGSVDIGYVGGTGTEIAASLDTSTSTNEMYGTDLLDQPSGDRTITATTTGVGSGPFLLVVHYVDSLNK